MAARRGFCLILSLALLAGCRSSRRIHDPEYAHLLQAAAQAGGDPDPVAAAIPDVYGWLEGPHPVEDYIDFALGQNPAIDAARKRMEALAHQVPVAAGLQDPMLNLTVQPEPVETAAGQQELILAASQKLPGWGKRQVRACIAESEARRAQAQLAAAQLETVQQVKQAYYELYFIQQAIAVTEAEQQLLSGLRDVAQARYASGQTSQQDVLRAELEISNVKNELIRLQQRRQSGQAQLARVLHVAPETRLLPLEELSPQQAPRELARLQRDAVAARPELHARLAAIQRDQHAADLARLGYRPDLTLGMAWIDVSTAGISPVADGQDALLLTAGVNLPVYRRRLVSSVRAAEAEAVATARDYDALREQTLAEVTDLFAQARSQRDLLVLFREDILPKARQTLEASTQAYRVGQVDFLQLLDNWRQLLRYEISYRRLDASLRQTLASLERTVGVPQAVYE